MSVSNPPPRRSKRKAADMDANLPKAYHPSYVNSATGELIDNVEVPESCIESTETILRKADNPAYEFTQGGLRSTKKARKAMHVHVMKGYNSVSLNVSDATPDQIFEFGKDKASLWGETTALDFLQLGQGAAFLRRSGNYQKGYNMHFLAMIKKEDGWVTLSDVSESEDWDKVTTVALETVRAKTVGGLRSSIGSPYTNETQFLFGLVALDDDTKRVKR